MKKNERGRLPELSVIGALCIEPEKLAPKLFDRLRPEDFGDAALRHLFEAGRELWLESAPLDAVTLLSRAGESYEPLIREAMAATPTAANWAEYAAIVRDNAQLREIQSVALRMLEAEDAEQARSSLAAAQGLLAEDRRGRRVTMADAMSAFMARRVEERKTPEFSDWGLPYMTDTLDTELGDFVVIGGYPSAGKTLLALQLAAVIARKYRVGFFSLETREKKLTNRLVSHVSGVPLRAIKHQSYSAADYRKLMAAAEQLYALPFTIEECAGDTVAEIRAKTLAGRYQVIFLDYLQLVNERGGSRYEIVTETSRKLHTLAQELGVLVVALAQLQRPDKGPKDGKPVPPGMSSLKESGQIEQDADAILLLYPENPNEKGSDRILKVGKNKEGEPIKPCTLAFRGAVQTFEELFPERPKPKPRDQSKRPGRDSGQVELPW